MLADPRPDGNGGGADQNVATPEDKAMTSDEDFILLDDPEFLAERKRVREALEYAPEASAELTGRYEKLSEEFLRRARAAWGGEE